MHLPARDLLATVLVAVALIAYAIWWLGGVPVLDQVSSVALIVLAMGVVASMSAVVPSFSELMHGSWLYLGAASLFGLVAMGAGVVALINEDGTALSLLLLATVALWAMSTARHVNSYARLHPTS
jgi:hypothetical protein